MNDEKALTFSCRGDRLLGILHPGAVNSHLGVVVVVGGPQYRVGSHRQFVLLARRLAAAGIPVLRFDCRGMGDSEGEFPGFEAIEDDIRSAVDILLEQQPSVTEVVLWGLCDGASAIVLYAPHDPRVKGVVLLNPYIHTEEGTARTYLRHYYLARLVSADFWRKVLRGQFQLIPSLISLLEKIVTALGIGRARVQDRQSLPSLPQRMVVALELFQGRMLVILSGDDLVGAAFGELVTGNDRWERLMASSRVVSHRLEAANHTFSRDPWRQQVEDWTLTWLEEGRS